MAGSAARGQAAAVARRDAVAARVRAATRRSRADSRRRDLAVSAASAAASPGGPW